MTPETILSSVGILFGLLSAIYAWTAKRQVTRLDALEARLQAQGEQNVVVRERLITLKEQMEAKPDVEKLRSVLQEELHKEIKPLRDEVHLMRGDMADYERRLMRVEFLTNARKGATSPGGQP